MEDNPRNSENPQRLGQRLRCIDEQIVSHFQSRLIKLAACRRWSTRRGHGNLRIINKNIG